MEAMRAQKRLEMDAGNGDRNKSQREVVHTAAVCCVLTEKPSRPAEHKT